MLDDAYEGDHREKPPKITGELFANVYLWRNVDKKRKGR
jgi:hypothetical protein